MSARVQSVLEDLRALHGHLRQAESVAGRAGMPMPPTTRGDWLSDDLGRVDLQVERLLRRVEAIHGRLALEIPAESIGSALVALCGGEEEDGQTDGPAYNAGRSEGQADVAAALRAVLDPQDREHLNLDGALAQVRQLVMWAKSPKGPPPAQDLEDVEARAEAALPPSSTPRNEIRRRMNEAFVRGEEAVASVTLPVSASRPGHCGQCDATLPAVRVLP